MVYLTESDGSKNTKKIMIRMFGIAAVACCGYMKIESYNPSQQTSSMWSDGDVTFPNNE